MTDSKPASILEIGKIALLAEGIKRGYSFKVLRAAPLNLILASKGAVGFIFQHWPGYITTQRRDDRYNLRDKEYQKRVLSSYGLPVPTLLQVVKHPIQIDLDKISFPVVCKPVIGFGSHDVIAGVSYLHELVAVVNHITNKGHDCLIEPYVLGSHYRLLVVWGKYVSCVERRPASVTGDGVHTVSELIEARNRERWRGDDDDLSTAVPYIKQDAETMTNLAEEGMAAPTIPSGGEQVLLQKHLLAAHCADLLDVTDSVNRDTVELCERCARELDLPLIGFDLISRDVHLSCSDEGAFNEINTVDVGTSVNEHCTISGGRPVSKHIWDGVNFEQVASKSFPEF